jgi:hypothetical protein
MGIRNLQRTLVPSEAIASWTDGRIDSAAMLRYLVAHNSWGVALASGSAQPTTSRNAQIRFNVFDGDGDSRQLFVFSDRYAREYFEAVMGSTALGDRYAEITGSQLFQSNFGNADYVVINPFSEDTLSVPREKFGYLNGVAGSVDVERMLLNASQGDTQEYELTRLKNFASYRVAFTNKAGKAEPELVLDPNSKGYFVAAFTADDCFDAFADAWEENQNNPPIKAATLKGADFCATLIDQGSDLDGVVFNARGPARPVILPTSFARTVMAA